MKTLDEASSLRPWQILGEKQVLVRSPFSVTDVDLETGKQDRVTFARVDSRDWVNVVPVNGDRSEVYLIRQYRVGSHGFVLETPGGVVEDDEHRDPTLTAQRELTEETGLVSKSLLPLGSFNPNSAFMNNKVHFFLATDCTPSEVVSPADEHEDIEVLSCQVSEIPYLIKTGRINHALSALALMLARPYLER